MTDQRVIHVSRSVTELKLLQAAASCRQLHFKQQKQQQLGFHPWLFFFSSSLFFQPVLLLYLPLSSLDFYYSFILIQASQQMCVVQLPFAASCFFLSTFLCLFSQKERKIYQPPKWLPTTVSNNSKLASQLLAGLGGLCCRSPAYRCCYFSSRPTLLQFPSFARRIRRTCNSPIS